MKWLREQHGFTITELLIGVTVSGLLIGVIFSFTLRYYISLAQSEVTTNMALESQAALSQLIEDVKLATGLSATNSLADANAPSGGWITSDAGNVIIVDSPATETDHEIIYNPETGYPYRNEFIYFLSGNNLYKRVLKNTTAPDNVAVTTCPAASASPSCPKDKLFSDKTTNITLTFYDDNNVATANATLARSVLVRIDMSKTVFGKTLTLSNSAQMTFRNE